MKHLLVLFPILFSLNVKSQDTPTVPCSKMLVVHNLGKKYETRFKKVFRKLPQYVHLNKNPLECPPKAVLDLLFSIKNSVEDTSKFDGLRIYLAQDSTKNLKFIFTAIVDSKDHLPYYIYNSTNSKFEIIDFFSANPMVTDFQEKTLIHFSNNLDSGNTKSYYFKKSQIEEICSEFVRQNTNNQIISLGIKLGVYVCNSRYSCAEPDYNNRLMMTFSFFDINHDEVYIEELKNSYGCVKQSTHLATKNKSSDNKFTGGLDTGTPCPPNSCDGHSLGK